MQWQVGLYAAAVLIPLFAFAVEAIFIRQLKRLNAYIATGAIGLSFLLSLVGFLDYFLVEAEGVWAEHHARRPRRARRDGEHGGEHAAPTHAAPHGPHVWQGSFDWVILGKLAPRCLATTLPPPSRCPSRSASTSTTCRPSCS